MENAQTLFNLAVAVAGFFGGWSLSQLTRTINQIDQDVRKMPLTYVTRVDYRSDIDEIKKMLSKISDKLDGKADK